MRHHSILLPVPRHRWFGRSRAMSCALILLSLVFLSGCCDPASHIIIQNNYVVPVSVRRVDPGGKTPGQVLDTVPAGKRVEIDNSPTLDGDIDYLQIEDAQGKVLTRLSSNGKNVVCKQKTPEYVWNISVGP